jgi:poly(A) polymerase
MAEPITIPASLRAALTRACGGAWYVVGGFVRDALLGRPTADLDLAVAADPAAVARALARLLGGTAFPLGAEHGVFRVALRAPLGGVAYVDVSALQGSIVQDLARRDFTVNALAWQPGTDTLLDPFDGLHDLREGVLRLVRDTAVRDDPLRGLRAVRFAAELGFGVDAFSAAVIRRDAPLLTQTAGERQRDELARVLDTPVAAAMLRLADDLGLLDVLLPELVPAKGCLQPREHVHDVFDHSVETVAVLDGILGPPPADATRAGRFALLWDALPDGATLRARYDEVIAEGRTRRALLKLVGLLHDVAKPRTRTVQANGRVRFFGHAELGARVAAAVLERLRYTAREARLAELLIAEHLRPGQLSSGHALPTRRALYRFFRDLGDAVPDLLLLNLADHAAARGAAMPDEAWAGHVASIAWMLQRRRQDETLARPPRLVTGHDLMAALSLPPGPEIGRLLRAVEEQAAVGTVRTRAQALRLARRLAREGPPARGGRLSRHRDGE